VSNPSRKGWRRSGTGFGLFHGGSLPKSIFLLSSAASVCGTPGRFILPELPELSELSELSELPELPEFENFQKYTHLIINELRSVFLQTIFRRV
jgi:hypothetical protein